MVCITCLAFPLIDVLSLIAGMTTFMGTGKKLGLGTVVLKCLHVHKSPGRLVGEKKKRIVLQQAWNSAQESVIYTSSPSVSDLWPHFERQRSRRRMGKLQPGGQI